MKPERGTASLAVYRENLFERRRFPNDCCQERAAGGRRWGGGVNRTTDAWLSRERQLSLKRAAVTATEGNGTRAALGSNYLFCSARIISTTSSVVSLVSKSCSTDHPFFSMKYVTSRRYLG